MRGRERDKVEGVVGIARRTSLHQFAVQMQHLRRTGALVQIVDVLRNDTHRIVLFQLRQQFMAAIGARFHQLPAQAVVKLVDEIRIALPSFRRGHLFHGMRLPKSATVTEGGKATLGTHAGSGEYHDFFGLCCHIVYDESTLQKYAFFKLTSRFTATKCDENAKKTTLAHIISKECLPLLQ